MTLADVTDMLRTLHAELKSRQFDFESVTSLDCREVTEARRHVWDALLLVSRVEARAAADEALVQGFNGCPEREPST